MDTAAMTDAELLWTARDAAQAEECLRTIGTPSAEAKCSQYLDVVLECAEELVRRRRALRGAL